MAGLNAQEKAGSRQLLEQLDTADLMSLTDTVTKSLIRVFSREEAIDAILVYSANATELLKRRKVHRDIIFKYLADQRIPVLPSSDKNQLIQHAINYWQDPGERPKPKTASQAKAEVPSHLGSLDCQLLGEQFCRWFYQLLNSQNPMLGQDKGPWGPQHFWEDAVLKFAYSTMEENMEEYSGAQMTSLRLLALTREEKLVFNPNIDAKGLKCVTSAHGLVVVAVAGTILRNNVWLGVFEQVFGLIRCPIGDNWKIRFVNLKVLGQNTLGSGESPPVLSIQYQTSDLEAFFT
uniref:Chromosome 3 open reading frame 38 n=1 Tax=Leptobrachium leishanense TaxID=445787 RepID=A0A8C5LJ21_9ANUR